MVKHSFCTKCCGFDCDIDNRCDEYMLWSVEEMESYVKLHKTLASKGVKGLKATNERQDDGAGILHQVAQFPIDQVYFVYTRVPCPSLPTQDPERQGNGC